MTFGSPDGGDHGKHNDADLVEISEYLRRRTIFSLEQHQLTEFRGLCHLQAAIWRVHFTILPHYRKANME